GTVGEGVLDAVGVEVLVDEVAAVDPAAEAAGLDRPGVLHPAALVNVVDVEVAVAAAAGPEEAVEAADLVEQLADAVRLGPGERRADRAVLSVGLQQQDVAELAGLDAVEQLLAGDAVPAHEADADLQLALLRLLGQLEHLAGAGAVHRGGLLHEDVDALLDGVVEVDPAEGRRRGEDGEVDGAGPVHS